MYAHKMFLIQNKLTVLTIQEIIFEFNRKFFSYSAFARSGSIKSSFLIKKLHIFTACLEKMFIFSMNLCIFFSPAIFSRFYIKMKLYENIFYKVMYLRNKLTEEWKFSTLNKKEKTKINFAQFFQIF